MTLEIDPPEATAAPPPRDSRLGEKAVRSAVVLAVARPLRIGVMLVSTAVLARLLTPGDFGLLGMAVAVTRFVEVFKQVGLGSATIQRPQLSDELSSSLFWVNVAAALVLAAVTAAVAPAVAWFYGEDRLVGVVLGLAVGLAISGAGVQPAALMKRHMRFKSLVGVELAAAASSTAIAIACASQGLGYWSLVIQMVSREAVSTVGSTLLSGLRIKRPGRATGMGESLRFGLDVSGINILNFFARNVDDILIGRFLGPQVLGLYQKAYELLMLPMRHVTGPVTGVAVPSLSRLQAEPERFRDAYRRMLDLVLIVSTPMAAWLVGSTQWIIASLLGPKWLEVVPILQAFGLLLFVQPLTSTSGWLFVSTARTREMLRWSIVGSSIVIVAVLIGLRWGAVGVAWGYSLSAIIRVPILLWFVGMRGPVTWRDKLTSGAPFLPAGVAALISTVAFSRAFPSLPSLVGAVVSAVLSGAVVLATLLSFAAGRRALGAILRARELLRLRRQ
jgi:PST family polysaccharide transporter